ncbi:ComF family protein [Desulfosarcina sp. OttesenSCG-928-G17]|nr:ComF family protein [Desulfosarcina sp. OttesenSCG-928-G17]
MDRSLWQRISRQLLRNLAAGLFPLRCRACNEFFTHDDPPSGIIDHRKSVADFGRAVALHFCPSCRQRWTPVTSPMCPVCGLVFKSRAGEDHLCGRCLSGETPIFRARSMGIYDQTLRAAIHALKFGHVIALADPLGALLGKTFRRHWQPGEIDLITPIPLHRRRFRQRGFNQSWLLIRKWRLPPSSALVRDLLVRTRATASQTGLGRKARRENIKNAFAVRDSTAVSGKRVLLVDDVMTTGATAEACAKVLLKSGARQVDLITLARTV